MTNDDEKVAGAPETEPATEGATSATPTEDRDWFQDDEFAKIDDSDGLATALRKLRQGDEPAAATAKASADKADEADPATEAGEDQATGKSTDEADEAPPIARPTSWSPDLDARWQALPRDVQQHIATRERQATTRIAELGSRAKQAEPILGLMQHYGSVFERHRVDPHVGLERLMRAQMLLDTDPEAGLRMIAQTYGVNLHQLGQQSDAQLTQLKQERAMLRMGAQLEENRRRAEAAAAEDNNVSSAERLIDEWSADKEHFAEVSAAMHHTLPLVDRTGKTDQQVLDEAYERACYAVPEVRAKVLEQQRKASEKAAEKAARTARHQQDAARNRTLNAGADSVPFSGGKNFDMDNDTHMMTLLRDIRARSSA